MHEHHRSTPGEFRQRRLEIAKLALATVQNPPNIGTVRDFYAVLQSMRENLDVIAAMQGR